MSENRARVEIDMNGLRNFTLITTDRDTISEDQWWIEMLWRHLNRFENEQHQRILDVIKLTEEASRKAKENSNAG